MNETRFQVVRSNERAPTDPIGPASTSRGGVIRHDVWEPALKANRCTVRQQRVTPHAARMRFVPAPTYLQTTRSHFRGRLRVSTRSRRWRIFLRQVQTPPVCANLWRKRGIADQSERRHLREDEGRPVRRTVKPACATTSSSWRTIDTTRTTISPRSASPGCRSRAANVVRGGRPEWSSIVCRFGRWRMRAVGGQHERHEQSSPDQISLSPEQEGAPPFRTRCGDSGVCDAGQPDDRWIGALECVPRGRRASR